MKKILATAILAATTLAASAQQINPTIDSLFARINALDFYRYSYNMQSSTGMGIAIFKNISFFPRYFENNDPEVERIRQKENRNIAIAIADIRSTFERLAKTAPESYRMETHIGGMDTMKFAINLSPNPMRIIPTPHGLSHIDGASESALYDHMTSDGAWGANCYLSYTKRIVLFPNEENTYYPTQSFDHATFKQQVVDKVLIGNDLQRREIHWRHPNSQFNDVERQEYLTYGYSGEPGTDNFHCEGETVGTVYFMPADKKEQADELLRQLSEASYAYVNANPRQTYNYYFDIDYGKDIHLCNVLYGRYSANGNDIFDSDFDIRTYSDDAGYYILVLNTTGYLWIPKEFARLKSFVDGKKVYEKGMAPKRAKGKK